MSIDDTARRISIGLDPHGRPIARKHGDPDRLRHEADVLAQVQCAGVVRLVAHDQLAGELDLAWTGGRTLADPPAHRPAVEVLGIARTLARTVATIHSVGVVHRRIEPSHVLVTDDGPLLTGFAEATMEDDGQLRDAHIDVAAIGHLIEVLLGPASVPARPEPRTTAMRWMPMRTRGTGVRTASAPRTDRAAPDHTAATLRRVARRAQDRSTAPCTIDELCTSLDLLFAPSGTPGLPAPRDGGGRHPTTWRDRLRDRRRGLVVAAVLASSVVALIIVPRLAGPGDRVAAADTPNATTIEVRGASGDTAATATTAIPASPAPPASTSASPTTAPVTTAPVTTAVFTGELIWPPTTPMTSEPDQFTVRGQSLSTGIVESGGVRYRLAADPQDRWLTGDWDCDSTASLAILRLPSGAVDVFDAWPESGRSVTSRRVALVAGAVELAATTDRCPRLAVTDAGGNVISLVAS